jgi:hypothetical protein
VVEAGPEASKSLAGSLETAGANASEPRAFYVGNRVGWEAACFKYYGPSKALRRAVRVPKGHYAA